MTRMLCRMSLVLLGFLVPVVSAQESVAKITMVEGTASMLRPHGKKWRPVRPGLSLGVGDQVYTQPESFLEIRYKSGAVLRLDESTKITIEHSSEQASHTRTGLGNVWVNMRKMAGSGGHDFEVSSPTATAAIRGTVFHMATDQDSTSSVAVYNGKVAVGPNATAKDTTATPSKPFTPPTEVPGPEEIPGPYEVSLETWTTIVAGQRISVRKDGMFAKESFEVEKKSNDAFVERNKKLDRELDQPPTETEE